MSTLSVVWSIEINDERRTTFVLISSIPPLKWNDMRKCYVLFIRLICILLNDLATLSCNSNSMHLFLFYRDQFSNM